MHVLKAFTLYMFRFTQPQMPQPHPVLREGTMGLIGDWGCMVGYEATGVQVYWMPGAHDVFAGRVYLILPRPVSSHSRSMGCVFVATPEGPRPSVLIMFLGRWLGLSVCCRPARAM